ncbi:hypothetical protein KC349_g146 [Hortaea werneckii]|nr:hypothetical protein KC349_g146 [Hortaea werneckii]
MGVSLFVPEPIAGTALLGPPPTPLDGSCAILRFSGCGSSAAFGLQRFLECYGVEMVHYLFQGSHSHVPFRLTLMIRLDDIVLDIVCLQLLEEVLPLPYLSSSSPKAGSSLVIPRNATRVRPYSKLTQVFSILATQNVRRRNSGAYIYASLCMMRSRPHADGGCIALVLSSASFCASTIRGKTASKAPFANMAPTATIPAMIWSGTLQASGRAQPDARSSSIISLNGAFDPEPVNSFGPELGSSLSPNNLVNAMPEFASMDLNFVASSIPGLSSPVGSGLANTVPPLFAAEPSGGLILPATTPSWIASFCSTIFDRLRGCFSK